MAASRAGELFEYQLGRFLVRQGLVEEGSARLGVIKARHARPFAERKLDAQLLSFWNKHVDAEKNRFAFKSCNDGCLGDTADIVMWSSARPQDVVSISCKANNTSVKHPRPRTLARRLGRKTPTRFEANYDAIIAKHHAVVDAKGYTEFAQLPRRLLDKLYGDVLDTWLDELRCDKVTAQQARRLYTFLTGNSTFVLVKRQARRDALPRLEVWRRVEAPGPKSLTCTKAAPNALEIRFDNGVGVWCRLHTASRRITRNLSLKFDVSILDYSCVYERLD